MLDIGPSSPRIGTSGDSVETTGIHIMRASPANRRCLTERKENSSAPVSHGGVLFLQDAMKPLVEVGAACQACSNQTSHTSPRCKSAAPESSTSATFFAPDTWTQNSRSGVAFALRLQLQRLTSPAGPSSRKTNAVARLLVEAYMGAGLLDDSECGTAAGHYGATPT